MIPGAFIIQPRTVFSILTRVPGRTGYKACLLYSLLRYQSGLWRWEEPKIWKTPQSIRQWAVALGGADCRSVRKAFAALVKIKFLVRCQPDDYIAGSPLLFDLDGKPRPLAKSAEFFAVDRWKSDCLSESTRKIVDKYERSILSRTDLSDTAKLLFIILSSLHNAPGMSEASKARSERWLAKWLSVTDRCIRSALRQLREINSIKTKPRTQPGVRQWRDTNLHIVLPSAQWKADGRAAMGIRTSGKRRGATRWPADLVLTDDMAAYAALYGIDAEVEFESWFHYCRSHDCRYVDWQAAWRMRIRRACTFELSRMPRLSPGMAELKRLYDEAAQERANGNSSNFEDVFHDIFACSDARRDRDCVQTTAHMVDEKISQPVFDSTSRPNRSALLKN